MPVIRTVLQFILIIDMIKLCFGIGIMLFAYLIQPMIKLFNLSVRLVNLWLHRMTYRTIHHVVKARLVILGLHIVLGRSIFTPTISYFDRQSKINIDLDIFYLASKKDFHFLGKRIFNCFGKFGFKFHN